MLVAVLSWHGTAVEIWFNLDEVVVYSAKVIFILEADLAWLSAFIGSISPVTNLYKTSYQGELIVLSYSSPWHSRTEVEKTVKYLLKIFSAIQFIFNTLIIVPFFFSYNHDELLINQYNTLS